MIDLPLAKTLRPGELVAVVVYGGKLQPAIFKTISKAGAFQFFGLTDRPLPAGGQYHLWNDRVYGAGLGRRVVKMDLSDLGPEYKAHYDFTRKETQAYFNKNGA